MKTMLLVLIAGALAVPALAFDIETAENARMEIARIRAEMEKERKQPQSGSLASRKWDLAANLRILELIKIYRSNAWAIDIFTNEKWLQANFDVSTKLVEIDKKGIEIEEAYIKRTGHESQQPCTYFFTPESNQDPGLLYIFAGSCIIDMPHKYPTAWARLKAAIPLVEFSKDAPPSREALYRAFVEGGVVAPPPTPKEAVVIARPSPEPKPAEPEKTKDPSDAELRNFMEPLKADLDLKPRDYEIENFLAYVIGKTGLPRELQPIVQIDSKEEACGRASVKDGRRYIAYNPNCNVFGTKPAPGEPYDWNMAWLMTHELGHHAKSHGGASLGTQIEANEWAGWAMYQLGATLEQAQRNIDNRKWEEGSQVHLAAIERGWNQARSEDKKPPEPQTIMVNPLPRAAVQSIETPQTSFERVKSGVFNILALVLGIAVLVLLVGPVRLVVRKLKPVLLVIAWAFKWSWGLATAPAKSHQKGAAD